jgi:hypothetical protein
MSKTIIFLSKYSIYILFFFHFVFVVILLQTDIRLKNQHIIFIGFLFFNLVIFHYKIENFDKKSLIRNMLLLLYFTIFACVTIYVLFSISSLVFVKIYLLIPIILLNFLIFNFFSWKLFKKNVYFSGLVRYTSGNDNLLDLLYSIWFIILTIIYSIIVVYLPHHP